MINDVFLVGLLCFTAGAGLGTYMMNRIVKTKDEIIAIQKSHIEILEDRG